MVRDRTPGSVIFDTFNIAFLTLLALACVLPLVHLVAVSFSGRWPSAGRIHDGKLRAYFPLRAVSALIHDLGCAHCAGHGCESAHDGAHGLPAIS